MTTIYKTHVFVVTMSHLKIYKLTTLKLTVVSLLLSYIIHIYNFKFNTKEEIKVRQLQ